MRSFVLCRKARFSANDRLYVFVRTKINDTQKYVRRDSRAHKIVKQALTR
jgi:hypothetical protein